MTQDIESGSELATTPVAAPKKKGRAVLKDMIPLRTYALPVALPQGFKFSEHMPKILGFKPFAAAADLLWGVHGTTSLNAADAYASRDSQHLGRRLYQLELLYRLNGIPPAGTSVTEDFAKTAGYLHFSRITSAFREKLRERMMDWLKDTHEPNMDEMADLDFEDLIKHRPMFVHHLMNEDKRIKAIIHPVFLSGGVTLRIATVRNVPANIVRVYTRFHEEILTTA